MSGQVEVSPGGVGYIRTRAERPAVHQIGKKVIQVRRSSWASSTDSGADTVAVVISAESVD